jgi:hypothetical protein
MVNRSLNTAKTCGNCMHFQPKLTQKGRVAKKYAGQCGAEVTLGTIPIAYRVTLEKRYVWFNFAAAECPCHEFKAIK